MATRPRLAWSFCCARNGHIETALLYHVRAATKYWSRIRFKSPYLEPTGELGNPDVASQVLLETVETMIMRGERRKLLLSNKAVDAYKRFRAERHLELVS